MKFSYCSLSLILLILLNGTSIQAQKRQKDIQDGNLFLSKPVKVDGKLNDWQDSLAAFNRTALLGYTIANDEKNLYLAIKSSDFINTARILSAGLTFSINTNGRKKEDEAYTITFPVSKAVTRVAPDRAVSAGKRDQSSFGGQRQFGRDERGQKQGRAADSAVIERRRSQIAQFKEIKVAGFKEIQDSLISIYNEYAIKVVADYDANGNMIYEMAVPLKLLGLNKDSKNELAYNIKINGRSFGARTERSSQGREMTERGGREYSADRRNVDFSSFSQPVDFWGKYSLAVK